MAVARYTFARLPLAALTLMIALTVQPTSARAQLGPPKDSCFPPPVIDAPGTGVLVEKEDLRYDGKDLHYWCRYLLTELKPERRVEALRALVHFGLSGYGTEAATAIVDCVKRSRGSFPDSGKLKDKEPDVVGMTGIALARIGKPAVGVLDSALKDPDNAVRLYAAGVLEGCFDPLPESAVPALVKAVQDPAVEVRDMALRALSGSGSSAPVPAAVRRALRGALAPESAARSFTAAICKLLRKDAGKEEATDLWFMHDRAFSVLTMIGRSARTAVPTLLEVLKTHKSMADRLLAAALLGKLAVDAERVVPALAEALRDPEPPVRLAAAQALGAFGRRARAAAPALRAALASPAPVQGVPESQAGLPAPLPPPVVPASATVYAPPEGMGGGDRPADQEWSFRLEVACALGRTGEDTRPVTPILLGTLRDSDPEGRQKFVRSIGERGAPAAVFVPGLLQAYKRYPENRAGIATALGGIGPAAKDALPLLAHAAQDKDPALRQAAAAAVRKIMRGK